MLLVFEGHVLEAMSGADARIWTLYKFIYAFHMPLFFLLSGFLSSTKPFDFRTRAMARLIPVLFFDLVSLVILVAKDVLAGTLQPGLYAFGLAALSKGYPLFNVMLWFVVALFVIEMIDHGLHVALKSGGRVFLASWLVFALGVAVTRKEKFFIDATGLGSGYWFLKQAFVALPFYECGVLLKRSRLTRKATAWVSLTVFIVSGGLLLALFDRNAKINLLGAIIGNPALMVVNGLLDSAMIIGLARILPPAAPLVFLGRNTLALLGLNGILTVFVNASIGRRIVDFSSDTQVQVALSVLATALSLLAATPFVLFLNRFASRALGKPSLHDLTNGTPDRRGHITWKI